MRWLLLVASMLAQPAWPLSAADLDARLERFSESVRCMVCQNESIAESQAELALDLKKEIRAQMQAGRSDEEIRGYLVARYGDFIYYRPPMTRTTAVLWAGPVVLLAVAGIGVATYVRRRARAAEEAGE